MTKYFCDRCGKKFEKTDKPQFNYGYENYTPKVGDIFPEIRQLKMYPEDPDHPVIIPMDLCYNCYEEIRRAVIPLFEEHDEG